MYPTTLLPALDLLDRRLVTRLLPQTSEPSIKKWNSNFYLVRSTAQTGGRFKDMLAEKAYEVRTAGMWCSCPGWAVASFPADLGNDEYIRNEDESIDENEEDNIIGPLLTSKGREQLGMCKHLLACLLVERVACLANYAEEKEVSLEELAGWAAGWGS
jgi:hypothetical protein